MSSWQTKSSKVVYENSWMLVREDEIIMPNGKDGLYGVVESKSDSVFIVAVDKEKNTYLVQQEHYTTQELEWQCPAGRTDGEPVGVAARRELLEEAGLRADTITVLTESKMASGMTTFRGTICLARGLHKDTSQFDESEIAAVKKVSLTSVKDMIVNGEIKPVESIAAYLLAIAHIERENAI